MKEEKKSHKLLNFILFIILFFISIFFYAKYLGVKGLKVKEYKIESSILTSNFNGFKIIHFSDLLYKSTIYKDDLKKLVDKINLYKPDIVIFTGDLFNKNIKMSQEDKEILINNLSNIKSNIGNYCIYGDYDYDYDYSYIMEKSKFKILKNSYETIYFKNNNFLYLVGFPSSIKDSIKLDDAFKFYNENERTYTIVLTHDGNTIKQLDKSSYEVDLILGGHSLNGSVVVPYYGGLFIPNDSYKYYSDYYKKGITDIYISSGIGTNDYKYRFNNKPSFNLYRLKAQT